MAAYRRDNLGFVFQDFNLLDTFSLRDNIFLPLVLARKEYGEMEERLKPLADRLEIKELLDKFPYEVSGGQKQRRQLPERSLRSRRSCLRTNLRGALDSRAADSLLRIFEDVNKSGQTVFMVTHSTRRPVMQEGSFSSKTALFSISCTVGTAAMRRCTRRYRIP